MNIVSLIILYQYRVHVLIAIFEVFNVKMFIELTDSIIIIIIISTVIIHDICAVIAVYKIDEQFEYYCNVKLFVIRVGPDLPDQYII